jgi:hypothetical protein
LVIELTNTKGVGSKRSRSRNMLKVSWRKTPSKRRREILVPASVLPQDARAMRSENRTLLISSIARGRRWLNELIADPTAKRATPTISTDALFVGAVSIDLTLLSSRGSVRRGGDLTRANGSQTHNSRTPRCALSPACRQRSTRTETKNDSKQ